MKDKILKELNFDTISFYDSDGKWFEGIENKDFNELADRLVKLFRQYVVISSLPDSDEIRMKARELDEKDFAQWMYEIQKGNVL